MVKPQGASKASKKAQPPILSHEFVIQNHGDIMSCIVMVFIVGLMFPLTHALSSTFIAPQYNGTYQEPGANGEEREVYGYLSGLLDLPALFFYTICWIVVHAVLQEYGLDKLQKKTHLSKVSTFKFGESFHMIFFTAYSVAHAVYLYTESPETFNDIKKIWTNYPAEHRVMSAAYKFYFIFQISYWIHQFPEFYLQKLKKDEIRQKTITAVGHILLISVAYFFNFTRAGLVFLTIEYTTQFIFHSARLSHFLGKKSISAPGFKAFNILFIVARFAITILAVMTFFLGLRQTEVPFIDLAAGNFNTTVVRLNVLLAVLLVQAIQMYSFVTFQFGRYRENSSKKDKKKASTSAVAPKKEKKRNDSEGDKKKN